MRVLPVVLVAAVACAPPGARRVERALAGHERLAPSFPVVSASPDGAPAPTRAQPPDGGSSAAPSPGAGPSETAAAALAHSLADAVGDVTPSPADPAPEWADLAGATLAGSQDGWELRVRLAASAPGSIAGGRTFNVATFFEVDGDGRTDYEAWANLGEAGWGSASYDDRAPAARFGTRSGVAVSARGAEVVLRFGPSVVGGALGFRWALVSEYGRYELIGTDAAARDAAPDSGAAEFP
jgi:hypothetical protein